MSVMSELSIDLQNRIDAMTLRKAMMLVRSMPKIDLCDFLADHGAECEPSQAFDTAIVWIAKNGLNVFLESIDEYLD